MKNFITIEVLITLTIALWFLYVSFIPELWIRIMLISIVIIFFINMFQKSKTE